MVLFEFLRESRKSRQSTPYREGHLLGHLEGGLVDAGHAKDAPALDAERGDPGDSPEVHLQRGIHRRGGIRPAGPPLRLHVEQPGGATT